MKYGLIVLSLRSYNQEIRGLYLNSRVILVDHNWPQLTTLSEVLDRKIWSQAIAYEIKSNISGELFSMAVVNMIAAITNQDLSQCSLDLITRYLASQECFNKFKFQEEGVHLDLPGGCDIQAKAYMDSWKSWKSSKPLPMSITTSGLIDKNITVPVTSIVVERLRTTNLLPLDFYTNACIEIAMMVAGVQDYRVCDLRVLYRTTNLTNGPDYQYGDRAFACGSWRGLHPTNCRDNVWFHLIAPTITGKSINQDIVDTLMCLRNDCGVFYDGPNTDVVSLQTNLCIYRALPQTRPQILDYIPVDKDNYTIGPDSQDVIVHMWAIAVLGTNVIDDLFGVDKAGLKIWSRLRNSDLTQYSPDQILSVMSSLKIMRTMYKTTTLDNDLRRWETYLYQDNNILESSDVTLAWHIFYINDYSPLS